MNELQDEWDFARQLTVDLLKTCDSETLEAVPMVELGPVWKVFRHLGRVHENYLDALETGALSFSPQAGSFTGPASRTTLLAYFRRLSIRHNSVFARATAQKMIQWDDEVVSTSAHLVRLIAHESLHHGQLMLAWRNLHQPLPPSWAAWGET